MPLRKTMPFLIPVPSIAIGAIAMHRNQIPATLWGQNVACLVLLGFLTLLAIKRKWAVGISGHRKFVLPALLALLTLTFANQGVEGVHRWLPLGFMRVNVAMLILPLTLIELWSVLQGKSFWLGCGVALGIVLILFLQPDASQLSGFAVPAMLMLGGKAKSKALRIAVCCAFSPFIVCSWIFPDSLPPVSYVESILNMVAGMGLVWLVLGVIALALLPIPFLLFPPQNAKPMSRYIGCYYIIILFSTVLGNFPVPLMGYGISPIIGYSIAILWYFTKLRESSASPRAYPEAKASKPAELS